MRTENRRTSIVACVAALALLVPAATATAKPLKRGSHGPRVENVQRWLGVGVDGIFGPAT